MSSFVDPIPVHPDAGARLSLTAANAPTTVRIAGAARTGDPLAANALWQAWRGLAAHSHGRELSAHPTEQLRADTDRIAALPRTRDVVVPRTYTLCCRSVTPTGTSRSATSVWSAAARQQTACSASPKDSGCPGCPAIIATPPGSSRPPPRSPPDCTTWDCGCCRTTPATRASRCRPSATAVTRRGRCRGRAFGRAGKTSLPCWTVTMPARIQVMRTRTSTSGSVSSTANASPDGGAGPGTRLCVVRMPPTLPRAKRTRSRPKST